MISPAANANDPRYLSELAFKNIIGALAPGFQVLITGDHAVKIHPVVLVKCTASTEAIAPGAITGNFKQRIEVELQQKLDAVDTEDQQAAVLALRQCFYRNDTDSRPNVDLANRLSLAVAFPYTCKGVLYQEEGPVESDSEVRVYAYKLAFDVFAIPNR